MLDGAYHRFRVHDFQHGKDRIRLAAPEYHRSKLDEEDLPVHRRSSLATQHV